MTKEERNLAKMVMPKKKKRLLEKIEYSKRKKASQVNVISVYEKLSGQGGIQRNLVVVVLGGGKHWGDARCSFGPVNFE